MTPGWINRKSVVTSVVTAVVLAVGASGVAWISKAQDSHELTKQSAQTQATMAEVVEQLAERAQAQDARTALIIQLCEKEKLAGADCEFVPLELPAVAAPQPSD